MDCFVHDILEYAPHQHFGSYELDILLSGSAEFCHGGKLHRLSANDVILINPGEFHASFPLEPNTVSLVIHFSAPALKRLIKSEHLLSFNICSDVSSVSSQEFKLIRFFSANLMLSLIKDKVYSDISSQSSLNMLISTFLDYFEHDVTSAVSDYSRQDSMYGMLQYIDENFSSKITLEELSNTFMYNRTYISTFFKENLGIGFYDYLTRVRFQHAVWELAHSEKNLTQIAIDNGFSDLKTMNRQFKSVLHLSPAEYRSRITSDIFRPYQGYRRYRDDDYNELLPKLREYLTI
jgi:AraC-like DNA-binding protein